MEKVLLRGAIGRKVKWMNQSQYQKVFEFIMDELQTSESLPLHDLIERATLKLGQYFPANYTWALLQVKQDMEARGIIKSKLDRLKNQTIMIAGENQNVA